MNVLDEEMHNIVSVSYRGHPGTYYAQPEPAEGLLYCPKLGDTTDGQWEYGADPEWPVSAWCAECDEEVTAVIDLKGQPDRKEVE